MLKYLLKRILYFIPTLFLISLIVYFLSKSAGEYLACYDREPQLFSEADCIKEAQEKGYDQAIFYFSLSTAAHPDTLHRIYQEEQRIVFKKLIGQFGNWEQIQRYHQTIKNTLHAITQLESSGNNNALVQMRKTADRLKLKHKPAVIESHLKDLEASAQDSLAHSLLPTILALQKSYQRVKQTATPYKLWIPQFQWHGFHNQYHRWIKRFIVGDFGVSNRDSRPVSQKIWDRLPWTLAINIPAIFLAYLLSIPLGVYSAVYKDSAFDKRVSTLLLLLFSLPGFWVATILVNLFTTAQYGMKIFPSIGVSSLSGDVPFWQRFLDNFTHLLLPIICVTYGALAFMSRQLRNSMLETLQQDFIKTARAKGLTERQVIWKHAFQNSIFPLITIFGSVLPRAFAGSVVLEVIFNIQGMGYLMWDSIFARDWQVVYTVLMIAAVLTVVGLLLADILYAFVDPRVRFGRK